MVEEKKDNYDSINPLPLFSGFRPRFAPDERTDAVLKQVLLSQLEAMEYYRSGITDDSNPEFLHRYRIAVRRSRSLLGQLKKVFPKKEREWALRQLAWLGSVTGPLRDIDVALSSFDDYRKSLPARRRDDLEPLRELLQVRRSLEYRLLSQALSSRRCQNFLLRWRRFLQATVPCRTSLQDARRPVADVAGERIRKLYRRAIKQGRAADKDAAPEKLHELRKTGKKLRYLIESFRGIYPDRKTKKVLKDIKRLLTNLGAYQDLHVQIGVLEELSKPDRTKKGGLPEATRSAITLLVKILKKKQRSQRDKFERIFPRFSAGKKRVPFHRLFR